MNLDMDEQIQWICFPTVKMKLKQTITFLSEFQK